MKDHRFSAKIVIISVVMAALVVACAQYLQTGQKPAAATTHPEADFSRSCVECHTTVTPDITAQWASSGHGKLNYGCYICHGDGEQVFTVKPGTDGCISCHSSSMEHLEDAGETSCFKCHNGHNLTAE